MKPIVSATIRTAPQFYDIDPMNIVWHGNYPRFFELARVALLERIDYGYDQMVRSGFGWPVIDMQIRYAHPIKLNQQIDVQAGVVEWENRLKMAFEIRDADTGKRLSRGSSTQVAVEIETERMLWETPPILREKLEPFL